MPLCALAACACLCRGAELQDKRIASPNWNALALPYSPLANPAVLARTDFISVRASLSSIPDRSYAHELGATLPVGLRQSIGATWMMHAFNKRRLLAPDTDNLRDKTNLGLLTYAVKPWEPVSVGLNVNFVHHAYDDAHGAGSVGADAGVAGDVLNHARLGTHTLGASIHNAYPPAPGDSTYARAVNVSLLSAFMQERLEHGIRFSVKDPSGRNSATAFADRWNVFGRLTFMAPANLHFHFVYGFHRDGPAYLGAAGGFDLPTYVYAKKRDAFSLAYQHCWLIPDEMSSISIFARTEAGPHRLNADILFEQAFAHYRQMQYWEALDAFGRVIAEYPNYVKNDVASCHMALCELELGMDSAAAVRCARIPEQYPGSAAIARAIPCLMTVRYRWRDYKSLMQLFTELTALQVSDSIRYHGTYLVAQAHMRRSNYARASALLMQIPRWHPDYSYARHSAAIAQHAIGKTDSAMHTLERLIRIETTTTVQREIINRSRVMLGYLYYEHSALIDSALAKATMVLRKVPRESCYFTEALLGLGWTSFRAGQWTDCVRAAEELSRSDAAVVRAEGLALKAYAFYAQARYKEAIKILEQAQSALGPPRAASSRSADSTLMRHGALVDAYNADGIALDRLLVSRRTPRHRRALALMMEKQKRVEQAIWEQSRALHNEKKLRAFGRDREKLREDILYARASATYLIQSNASHRTLEPGLREQILDRRIRRREQKLQRLEERK